MRGVGKALHLICCHIITHSCRFLHAASCGNLFIRSKTRHLLYNPVQDTGCFNPVQYMHPGTASLGSWCHWVDTVLCSRLLDTFGLLPLAANAALLQFHDRANGLPLLIAEGCQPHASHARSFPEFYGEPYRLSDHPWLLNTLSSPQMNHLRMEKRLVHATMPHHLVAEGRGVIKSSSRWRRIRRVLTASKDQRLTVLAPQLTA